MSLTPQTWQQELADGFDNAYDLLNFLHLPSDIPLALSNFPVRVPKEFASRMAKGTFDDPLLKQVLPVPDEDSVFLEFNDDPVGDIAAIAETGVIHKYQHRVLFLMTGGCAINCRYCFRRNFPYADFQLSGQKIHNAIRYISDNNSISEVILSGGDPLLLNDQKLTVLFEQLSKIRHLKRIRIHSRIPIVLPSRITPTFCNIISNTPKSVILVVHSNHQNELNAKVHNACKQLKNHDITLLNQSVLLKNINNNAHQLSALSEKLFTFGILPYYLHLLDKANGTAHFEVKEEPAIALMNQIKNVLPGYLVPKLVREQAGASHKIIIN